MIYTNFKIYIYGFDAEFVTNYGIALNTIFFGTIRPNFSLKYKKKKYKKKNKIGCDKWKESTLL